MCHIHDKNNITIELCSISSINCYFLGAFIGSKVETGERGGRGGRE